MDLVKQRWEQYYYPLDASESMVPKKEMPKSIIDLFGRVHREGLKQGDTSIEGEEWITAADGHGAYMNFGASRISGDLAIYQLSLHWQSIPVENQYNISWNKTPRPSAT